jgi:hypothetical protein
VFERVHIDLGRFKDPPEKEASLMRFANGGVKDAQWLCNKNAMRWYKPRTDGTSRFVFPTIAPYFLEPNKGGGYS